MTRRLRIFALLAGLLLGQACAYTVKIKDGPTAYQQKQYARAIQLLTKKYHKTGSPAEKGKIAFMIGESYRLTGRADQAVDWYAKAYAKSYGPDALKAQALALKQKGDYEMAILAFQELGREIGSPYEYRREINACQNAIDWTKTADRQAVTISTPPEFNSDQTNEYALTPYRDGQFVFVSDRSRAVSGKKNPIYPWTGRPFTDLFRFDGRTVRPFDPKINSPHNEGPLCFNQDFTEVYFTRCDLKGPDGIHCRILRARWDGTSWTGPVPLEFQTDSTANYMHPCLSPDDNLLYFAANLPDGWGGYDLYLSERTRTGWSTPHLLSRIINTPGNEVFPTISGDTLYFSSDYLGGMGGLDIFKTVRTGFNQWTPPVNMKAPVNSPKDDFCFLPTAFGNGKDFVKRGFLSSNRNGSDDILAFIEKKKIQPPAPAPPPTTYKNFLTITTLEKIFATPDDPNSKILGRKPLPGVELTIRDDSLTRTIQTNENGEYMFELPENRDFTITGKKDGYLAASVTYSSKGFGRDPAHPVQHFDLELTLDKIFKNKEIRIRNIYYDFDKWEIRADAKPELDKLVRLLQRNPDIKIELAAHTDCRGSEKYNRELSQKRAESVVKYLISKGIDATRLVARGYGESSPAVPCPCSKCTEEQHQINRRTTFKIL